MDARDAAVALFRATFSGEPDGVWEAPGRVNLIGEHTDYNAGLVLPVALPQRTYAAVRRRRDDTVAFASAGQPGISRMNLADIGPGNPNTWARYPAGVLWALSQGGFAVGGLEVAFASDVPIGAGLSSSAAIEGAMAAAASDLFGLGLLDDDAGRAQLAAICQRAENEIAGAPTGGMDQAACLRCEEGHALFLDCADGSVTQVPFRLSEKGPTLLVIDTKVTHSNAGPPTSVPAVRAVSVDTATVPVATWDGSGCHPGRFRLPPGTVPAGSTDPDADHYGARRADCEEACALLGLDSLRELTPGDLPVALARLGNDRLRRRVRHVVTETERVRLAVRALEADDFEELGRLFIDSHASLRDDYEVSCPELDLAVVAALEAGALGARMTGGGFGGSAIALVYEQALPATRDLISDAFRASGLVVPDFFPARAAGPARRS